jgi:thiamine kinase-like enzyme
MLRLPGERTEVLGIDRACEAEAAERAAALGIGPPVLGPLPGVGTLITRFVYGAHATDPTDFQSRLPQVIEAVKAFHSSGPIKGRFPIHRVVEWHARDAAAHGVQPPKLYGLLLAKSHSIEVAFAAAPQAEVPCHNDLLPANVLFDGERVWLLDFEYAGMNDRFFDLGNLSVNSEFGQEKDAELLTLYFGGVTPARWARLQLMKMMSEFREGMWGVVQQAISTLTNVDFVEYADKRLESCQRIAESPDFERWLDDARGSVA